MKICVEFLKSNPASKSPSGLSLYKYQMKITEILEGFQLQKNQWALDISNDAKHEVSDDLINLVQTAYAGTAQGSFVNNVSNLLPSDWAVLDFDADPDVDSAVFYRGPRAQEPWTGFKIQGLGHDGSRVSKDRALSKLAEMLHKPGWWIESSGALRSVLARRGCPAVSNQQLLQGLFPDSDLQMIDNTTYTRRLPEGGLVTETVFGNPRLNKMTGQLAEAFNQPYKTKWKKSNFAHPGSSYSEVQLPDGTPLIIVFFHMGDGKYNVEFTRNQSGGLTGRGDAQKIFATVLHDIIEFAKERKPQQLAFTASKEMDPNSKPGVRANPNSRAKLYTRMVRRYAEPLGYRVQYQEVPSQLLYTLTQITPKEETLEEETLEELVGIKNKVKNLPGSMPAYDDETRVRYTHGMKWNQVMQDHGFQQLGSGLQASVYGHPKLPYVLKLFRSEDVAYAEWIKVAMANKNNPHMPRFVSKRMVRITQDIVAIRMEPLSPIEGIFLKIHLVSDRLLEGGLAASQPPSRLAGKLAYLPEYKHFEQYCNTHPNWMAALDIAWHSMQSHGNDFHPGNCMLRGDDMVITDPVQ